MEQIANYRVTQGPFPASIGKLYAGVSIAAAAEVAAGSSVLLRVFTPEEAAEADLDTEVQTLRRFATLPEREPQSVRPIEVVETDWQGAPVTLLVLDARALLGGYCPRLPAWKDNEQALLRATADIVEVLDSLASPGLIGPHSLQIGFGSRPVWIDFGFRRVPQGFSMAQQLAAWGRLWQPDRRARPAALPPEPDPDSESVASNLNAVTETLIQGTLQTADEARTWVQTQQQRPVSGSTTPTVLSAEHLKALADQGYHVGAMLGRGGLGAVFEGFAEGPWGRRPVAIKVVLPGLAGDPQLATEFRTRFQTEADTLAKLHHPNIVGFEAFVDLEPESGLPEDGRARALVMEKLTGVPLMAWCAQLGTPRAEAILTQKVLPALVSALQHIHEHPEKLVHRDLSTNNMMMTFGDVPKLIDFGLAKQGAGGAGLTQTGAGLGTQGYMPPDQMGDAKRVTRTADLYAMGVALLKVLTPTPIPDALRFLGVLHDRDNGTIPIGPLTIGMGPLCYHLCVLEEPDKFPSTAALVSFVSTVREEGWFDRHSEDVRFPRSGSLNTYPILTDAWQRVLQQNVAAAALLVGPAGTGKSRAMRELQVHSRFWGERDVYRTSSIRDLALWLGVAADVNAVVEALLKRTKPAADAPKANKALLAMGLTKPARATRALLVVLDDIAPVDQAGVRDLLTAAAGCPGRFMLVAAWAEVAALEPVPSTITTIQTLEQYPFALACAPHPRKRDRPEEVARAQAAHERWEQCLVECGSAMKATLGVLEIDTELLDEVVAAVGVAPLPFNATVEALQEGVHYRLRNDGTEAVAVPFVPPPLVPEVLDALATALDALTPEQRRLLAICGTLGPVFEIELQDALLDKVIGPGMKLGDGTSRASVLTHMWPRVGPLLETRDEDTETPLRTEVYPNTQAFSPRWLAHAAVRYALTDEETLEVHRVAADWLETQLATRWAQLYEVPGLILEFHERLVRHLRALGERPKWLRRLRDLADQAYMAGHFKPAEGYLTEALGELADGSDEPLRARCLALRAAVRTYSSSLQFALQDARDALGLADGLADRSVSLDVWSLVPTALMKGAGDDQILAEELLSRGDMLVKQSDDPLVRSRLAFSRGWLHLVNVSLVDYNSAIQSLSLAIELLGTFPVNQRGQANALAARGRVYGTAKESVLAETDMLAAAIHPRAAVRERVTAYLNLGYQRWRSGQYSEAVAAFAEAERLAQKYGLSEVLVLILYNEAFMGGLLGHRPVDVRRLFERSNRLTKYVSATDGLGQVNVAFGEILWVWGELDTATEVFGTVVSMGVEALDTQHCYARAYMSRICFEAGDLKSAKDHLDSAESLAQRLSMDHKWEAHLTRLWATAAGFLSDTALALEAHIRLHDLFGQEKDHTENSLPRIKDAQLSQADGYMHAVQGDYLSMTNSFLQSWERLTQAGLLGLRARTLLDMANVASHHASSLGSVDRKRLFEATVKTAREPGLSLIPKIQAALLALTHIFSTDIAVSNTQVS